MNKIKKSYLSKVRRLNEVPSFAKKAVSEIKYQQRVISLRKKGAIPFTEEGFTKISWDLYRKNPTEIDAGSIWVKETIKNANGEEESWLVVNVDENDKIIRQVKASITKKAIVPGGTAMYEYEPGKFKHVFVEGIESQDPKTGENTFKVKPMWGGEEHFVVEEKKLKSAHIRGMKKTASSNDWVVDEEKLPNGYTVIYYAWVDDNDAGGSIVVIDSETEEEVDVPFDLPESFGKGIFEELEWGDIVDTDYLAGEYPKIVEKVKKLTPPPGFQYEMKVSKKTSHTPGAIVQVAIPQGGINEKYNGKVGEVVAAVPDRSKISFKDMPSLWFEDNTIKVVASCNVCGSDISLQSLKKLGKVKCRCGAFYSRRQLERIAKTVKINKEAVKKVGISQSYPDIKTYEEMEALFVNLFVNRVEKLIDEEEHIPDEAYQIAIEEFSHKRYRFGNMYFYYPDLDHRDYLLEELKERGIEISSKIASIKKAYIAQKGNEWCAMSEAGKSMGCYPTREKAEERLKQVEMFKHMKGSKKAQNVIFWFDDPKALKNLRYLQGPPTSPAGEEEIPLERLEGLEDEEKPEVEAKEVEKEASKTQKIKVSTEIKKEAKEKIGGIVKEGLEKTAQGGSSFEALRGGGV
ncbi:MAG: hypothetical protein KAW92_09695, partial [Candidatus Cloacimonetes bacterium]|nr:hypothetical protein [Candidatus Cloacimonadota bacterium]